MRYMFLIFLRDAYLCYEKGLTEMQQKYEKFSLEATQSGLKPQGVALQPASAAKIVRMHNGKTLTTDGPFAETKEQLAGYYILDCKDINEAIEWAANMLVLKAITDYGTIEIRPVLELDLRYGRDKASD